MRGGRYSNSENFVGASSPRSSGSGPCASGPRTSSTPGWPAWPGPPAGRWRRSGSILGSGPPCDLSGTSPAEHWIITKESSGYPTADNPNSTAFGLGQHLLGNRILYLGQDYATTDCGRQLWAFRSYVRDRYGTAERAKAFWQANGWY